MSTAERCECFHWAREASNDLPLHHPNCRFADSTTNPSPNRGYAARKSDVPHYRDGSPAAVGHVVRGKGYNLKNADGTLREFIGTVVGVTPGSESCNIQVAHIATIQFEGRMTYPHHRLYHLAGVVGSGPNGNSDPAVGAYIDVEYGQCDHFEKIG